MHSKRLLSYLGLAMGLASGCDDQAAPGYFGESLLTVTGSVEIANSRTRGQLSPALGFSSHGGSAIRIVDVPVHGTFPSDFRIELYEPPPESALHHPTRQEEGEPLVGLGYITAVTSEHPEVVYGGNSLSITYYGCLDQDRPDKLCLQETSETCPEPNVDNIPCYVEKRFCPTENSDASLCIVETSGNRAQLGLALDQFAGFSKNYQVIYLAQAAAPGSATAAYFDAEAGVPAGYGLYEVRPFSNEEAECMLEDEDAWELATRYYNEAHNTDYKNLRCDGLAFHAPHCSMPSPDLEGRMGPQGEVNRLVEKAHIELGCPISYLHYKRVDDPANTAISIEIDSNPPMPLTPPTPADVP